MTQHPDITVHDTWRALAITGPHGPQVAANPLLARVEREYAAGVGVTRRHRDLIQRAGLVTSGLRDLASHLAHRRRLTTEVRSCPYRSMGTREPIAPIAGRVHDPVLPDFIGDSFRERGIVRYGAAVNRDWLIAQICLAYPRANIAIPLPSLAQVQRLRTMLTQLGVDLDEVNTTWAGGRMRRIEVGLFSDHAGSIEWRDLVLFADAHYAFHDRARDLFGNILCRFRTFGLLPLYRHLLGVDADRAAETFGFDELSIPIPGMTLAPVATLWERFVDGSRSNGNADLRYHRRAVWSNRHRNCALSKLAKSALAQCRRPGSSPSQLDRSWARVVMVCQSIEHVAFLLSCLRGWPVHSDGPLDLTGLSRHHCGNLGRARRRWILDRVITTEKGLRTLPIPGNSQIFLWAGSGLHGPALPLEQISIPQPATMSDILPNVVCDLDDRSPATLARWAQRRRRCYLRAGYIPPGMSALDGRIARYLDEKETRSR